MNPDDMEALVHPIITNKADHVKETGGCTRWIQPNAKAAATCNRGALWFTTLAAGQPIGTRNAGTRPRRRSAQCLGLGTVMGGLWLSEFLAVNLAKQGFRLAEMPVQSIYRNESAASNPSHSSSALDG